ncbi:MAG: response regulator transcription factor [Pseudomonadota bacterium]
MNIFLIEDDLAIGRALLSVLQNEHHSVLWVRLAADALERIKPDQFDAVLLDLGLPDSDGLDLLPQLHAIAPGLPVLVISARDSLDSRLRSFAKGADDYLIKPFDIPELLARLHAVVRRARGRGDDIESLLTVRDLTLDERRQSLTRANVAITLSKTEFSLLKMLMKESARVVTRSELEDSVLPDSESQTLDVHMSNLRKKIGDGYIRTVRGVGFMVCHEIS